MKASIAAFIDELIVYDYVLFSSVLTIFIFLLILAVVLRRNTALTIFMVILSFVVLGAGPTLGYIKMHQILYKNTTELISQKKLTYTKAVVIYGAVKNISKFDFKHCKITASAYKVSGNMVKDYIFKLKPFANTSLLEYDILIDEEREFKLIIEPFTYSNEYNISLGASCR